MHVRGLWTVSVQTLLGPQPEALDAISVVSVTNQSFAVACF